MASLYGTLHGASPQTVYAQTPLPAGSRSPAATPYHVSPFDTIGGSQMEAFVRSPSPELSVGGGGWGPGLRGSSRSRPGSAGRGAVRTPTARTPTPQEAADLEREWDQCWEGLFGRGVALGGDGDVRLHASGSGSGGGGGSRSPRDASPAPGGSAFHSRHLVAPSHAAGIRHITEWLRNCGATTAEGRKEALKAEQEELACALREERMEAEELSVRLSTEMRELRDQCQQQGQTVGVLAQRLSDARNVVTSELRGAAVEREALQAELVAEEAQREALEAACHGEEAEIASRVEAAEDQLATMQGVRSSLEEQLHASHRVQQELREHIAAERGGRAELEIAGERELQAWSEHNSRVSGGGRSHSERAEAESLRMSASSELAHCRQECVDHDQEESRLLEQLQVTRERQRTTRAQLRSEAATWQGEVEVLRARVREADEELAHSEEALRRNVAALGACNCEREELEDELRAFSGRGAVGSGEFQELEEMAIEARAELQELREGIQRCRHDREAERLRQQRDALIQEVQAEAERHAELRDELEAERKGWSFMCLRRRPMPSQSPPVSPVSRRLTMGPPDPGPPPPRSTSSHPPPPRSTAPPPQPPRSAAPPPQPRALPPSEGGSAASSAGAAPQKRPQRPSHRGKAQGTYDAYAPGSVIATRDSAQMRSGEDLTSDRMYEIKAGHLCEVLGQAGRRLNVRDLETGEVGWISSATKAGVRLVQPAAEDQAQLLAHSASSAAAGQGGTSDGSRDIDEV